MCPRGLNETKINQEWLFKTDNPVSIFRLLLRDCIGKINYIYCIFAKIKVHKG